MGAALSVALTGGVMLEFDTRNVSVPIITEINVPVRNHVLQVAANSPVIVHAYATSRFGTAVLRRCLLMSGGREYFAAAVPGERVRDIVPGGPGGYDISQKREAPAEILILASEDNTEVTISPTGRLTACNECESVTLQRGEAYQVQSIVSLPDVATQDDIAGSYIFASKPVGVVSGNTRTSFDSVNTPMLAGNSVKDLAAEWLTPINLHGTSFIFTPTPGEFPSMQGDEIVRSSESVRLFGTTVQPPSASTRPIALMDGRMELGRSSAGREFLT